MPAESTSATAVAAEGKRPGPGVEVEAVGAGRGSVVEDEVLALVVKLSNYVTRREAQVQVCV